MQEQFFDFWCKPQQADNEDDMEAGHQSNWENFIHALPADLSGKRLLDFGCNQGGFLRLLYQQKPFQRGVGVDLASKAIEIAEARKGDLPLAYYNTGRPDNLTEKFDLCISTSVLYFIKDFAEHARIIHGALAQGGVYYASFIDSNGSKALPVWHKHVMDNQANIPFRIQTLEDIANGFLTQGFTVAIKRQIPQDFTPLMLSHVGTAPQDINDMLDLYYQRSYVFRFSKK